MPQVGRAKSNEVPQSVRRSLDFSLALYRAVEALRELLGTQLYGLASGMLVSQRLPSSNLYSLPNPACPHTRKAFGLDRTSAVRERAPIKCLYAVTETQLKQLVVD